MKKIIDAKPIIDKVKVILEKIQYENYLNSFENPAEVISRMDNIKELISSIKEQESLNKNLTIDEYLQSIALYTDSSVNDFKSRDNNSVKIMTIHFAKGAEFKVVFICGLYEGSLPTSRSINQNNLEEERRIFFVGITRARERLFLTSNIGSNYSGQCVPSYFLKEIGEKNYEKKTSEFSNISSANLE
jgi:DNA helicase-2/ATP-dependent DNA helicase PcrA